MKQTNIRSERVSAHSQDPTSMMSELVCRKPRHIVTRLYVVSSFHCDLHATSNLVLVCVL